MSGKFGVELPTMQAAAQHLDEVNNQTQSQPTSLLNRLEPLQRAWTGGLADGGRNYVSGESTNTSMWQG